MRQRKLYFPKLLSGKIENRVGRNTWLSCSGVSSMVGREGEGDRKGDTWAATVARQPPPAPLHFPQRCGQWEPCPTGPASALHSSASPPNKCRPNVRREWVRVLGFGTIRRTFILITAAEKQQTEILDNAKNTLRSASCDKCLKH